METYSKFRPTQFDPAGLALPDQQQWLVVPVIQTRDSEPLEQSNFATALKMLDPDEDSEDVETHSFNHWGPGWFDIIIVKPDTPAAKTAEEIEASLADYPVLDDEDYSRREWEKHSEWVEQELQRVVWANDGELADDIDQSELCDALQWDYHGRSPTDEDILEALIERGWFSY